MLILILLLFIMKKSTIFALIISFFTIVLAQQADNPCKEFIDNLIADVKTADLKKEYIPSIIYSGITTNNPGEMKQCLDSKYSYFLIHFNNDTEMFKSYTGTCLPSFCNTQNLQQTFKQYKLNVTVYDYPKDSSPDGLAITGIVIISLWGSILIVWSCIVSFKSEEVKQLVKKKQDERVSINEQNNEPLLESTLSVQQKYHNKIFVYYQGYKQIFQPYNKVSIFSPIMFFAVLSYLISVEFSYRLSVSENQKTTANNTLNSFLGVLVSNTEIALNTIMFIFGMRFIYSAYKLNSFKEVARFYFDQLLQKWVLLILMTLLVYSYITLFAGEPLNKIWNLDNGVDCPSTMWQIWFLFKNMKVDSKACLPWISIFSTQIFLILVTAPLILIFKSYKKIFAAIVTLIIAQSLLVSYSILQSHNIVYQPTRLMNEQNQFSLNYQPNTFVRMGAFYFGVLFGTFILEGLQKTDNSLTFEAKLAKNIRRNNVLAIAIHFVGFALMLTGFLLIIPYLSLDDGVNKHPFAYLLIAPLIFIIGLGLFILPNFWEAGNRFTSLINSLLGWKKWVHLDRISNTYLMIGPMIIACSTYSLQSNLYFDFVSVATYGIGDLLIAYIFSLVIASAFQYQLKIIWQWAEKKWFGQNLRYSELQIDKS